MGIVQPQDQKLGLYWELDGEKQSRCPRDYIRDNSQDFAEYMNTYSAFDKGYLPHSGGTDEQPAMFLPIMLGISSAIQKEQDYKKDNADQKQTQMEAFEAQKGLKPNRPTGPPTRSSRKG
jgi:hypothetical protein